MFYRSLGKDAEGIAVLAFIELILKYDGADFANWPGLARCKVHFALFDAMQKQGQIWENEAQVDTDRAAGTELLESCRDADGSLDCSHLYLYQSCHRSAAASSGAAGTAIY